MKEIVGAVTQEQKFSPCGIEMFSVVPGTPSPEALQMASVILSEALSVLDHVGDPCKHAAVRLVSSSKALIDSLLTFED